MSKNDNIYSEEIKLNAYYTYDKNYNKVYDTKGMSKRLKNWLKLLNRISKFIYFYLTCLEG